MGGKMSRNKGSRGELEVATIMNEALGIDVHRTPNSGAFKWHQSLKGDVQGLAGHHVEVKRAENVQLPAWLRQTEEDCEPDLIPLLVYRKSREPWRVVLPLDKYLEVLKNNKEGE